MRGNCRRGGSRIAMHICAGVRGEGSYGRDGSAFKVSSAYLSSGVAASEVFERHGKGAANLGAVSLGTLDSLTPIDW